jgi:hypothetical protein
VTGRKALRASRRSPQNIRAGEESRKIKTAFPQELIVCSMRKTFPNNFLGNRGKKSRVSFCSPLIKQLTVREEIFFPLI